MLANTEIIKMFNQFKEKMSEDDAIVKLFLLGYDYGMDDTYYKLRKLECSSRRHNLK